MRDKTVLLVSHGLQYLRECDTVLFLEEGRIVEAGQPEELLARPGGHLAGLAQYEYQGKGDMQDNKGGTAGKLLADSQSYTEEEEVVIQKSGKEESSLSSSSWAPLFRYLRECGNPLELGLIFICVVVFVLTRQFSSIFLQEWLDAGDGLEEVRRQNISDYNVTNTDHDLKGYINDRPDLWKYQLGYGMIILAMLLTGLIKGAAILFKLLRGSLNIHRKMIESITASPMAFFDVTPAGWILNRFSRDMDISEYMYLNVIHDPYLSVDTRIPFYLEAVGQYSMLIFVQVVPTFLLK